ncbi:MAG: metallophosphoesterase family protein [Ignavibacteriales bacterium]|nr:metallophosphoesterase family protein [Ignavibacteriales bacterium]
MKTGFLSDIHEDVKSLEIALKFFEKEKCDFIACLGDIVGFAYPYFKYLDTRNANECIRLVSENCKYAVAGNHDLFAIKKTPHHFSGFQYPDDWYELPFEVREKKARGKVWFYEETELKNNLNDLSKEFLNNLPEYLTIELKSGKIFLSHFCSPDITGSTIFFPSQTFHLRNHFRMLLENGCKLGFSGHGHPEGSIIVDEDNFSHKKYGENKIEHNPCWVVVPCVAKTQRLNGVAIFDTETKTVRTVQINSQLNKSLL